MKPPAIDLSAISLGSDGTVILSDEDLIELAASPDALSAGGDYEINVTTCTNTGNCNHSQNGHCMNTQGQCDGAKNNNDCMIIID